MSKTRQGLLALGCALLLVGCPSDDDEPTGDVPALPGVPLKLGALLCVTGSFSAKAPDLERSAILAQEYINGVLRPELGISAETRPCRDRGTCGVWGGRDEAGKAMRGPLRVIVADSGERPQHGVEAARQLVGEEHDVQAIVGPCTADVLEAVQQQVTKTETLLVTPLVTADSVTEIDDRSAADKSASLPGFVFRTITPDYVQAAVLGQLASNLDDPPLLVREADVTDEECTDEGESYCMDKHDGVAAYRCLPRSRSAKPEKIYIKVSDNDCADQPVNFCDLFGRNYECIEKSPGSSARVCAQYKLKAYCTKVARPLTAMVLYPDTPAGTALKTEVEKRWTDRTENQLVGAIAYDASKPATFASVVQRLFAVAEFQTAQLRKSGQLPSNYSLGDSVVFLFAEETEGALLMKEWSIQGELLADGASRVFWMATDILRNRLLLSQLGVEAVRNLYILDPYTTDINNGAFFEQLFAQRWQQPASDYTGNIFDTIVALTLANERAGYLRSAAATGGPLGPNGSDQLKNSLTSVTVGCERSQLGASCPDADALKVLSASQLPDAIEALGAGESVRYQGVTGDLSLSPEGDRIGSFRIWGVSSSGDKKSFVQLGTYTPQAHGIGLRK